jgi:hypothetical protein
MLAALVNVADRTAMPGTGLADTLLIVVGASLVGLAFIVSIVMWRKRG